jgi:Zn-dependent peptidase ImmA (M78 family)/transcriptional regulator with XRE-family HTH domain
MSPGMERLTAADAAKLFVGRRLTLARHLAGMRKNELAEQIGKTPTAIASYEAERSRPAPATVARLCIALGVEPGFFLATPGTESEPVSLEPHYRSLRSTTQLVRNQATAYGWVVHDIVAVFERHVEMPAPDFPSFTSTDRSPSEPATAAHFLREAWDLGSEPIKHLLRLAENHGTLCVFSPFEIATVDAYSFESQIRPIVILNPLKGDYYRQRWDLAHEIGHLVLHRDAEPGGHTVESEAHRFAAELLLPAVPIRELLPHRPVWPRLQALKEHWGVSIQALLYRGRELGVYSDVTYRNAMMRMSKEGWRRQEPGARPGVEQPSLLPGALKLLEESGISASQLASEARIPVSIFRIITARNVGTADRSVQHREPKSDSAEGLLNVVSLLSDLLSQLLYKMARGHFIAAALLGRFSLETNRS